MRPIAWLIGISLTSWLAVSAVAGDRVNPELLIGMLGPLLSGCATWVAVERVWRSAPERLTAVLAAGFAAKVLFFGLYVAMALRVLLLRPEPFVIAFVSYFIALHGMQSLFLKRLTARRETS